jgi:hypothetical protein
MRWLLIAVVACLTVKQAKDIHCRLSCLDEGEYGGAWSEKEKACVCFYVLVPAIPVPASGQLRKETYRNPKYDLD